jgi:hypothetical protein
MVMMQWYMMGYSQNGEGGVIRRCRCSVKSTAKSFAIVVIGVPRGVTLSIGVTPTFGDAGPLLESVVDTAVGRLFDSLVDKALPIRVVLFLSFELVTLSALPA